LLGFPEELLDNEMVTTVEEHEVNIARPKAFNDFDVEFRHFKEFP
jgi:hypothetical protein